MTLGAVLAPKFAHGPDNLEEVSEERIFDHSRLVSTTPLEAVSFIKGRHEAPRYLACGI